MPTASYSPPADASVTPPDRITLANVQPDDGIAPIIEFIESAEKSVDISIYRIDSDYTALIDALTRTVDRGVPVRISISRQRIPRIPVPRAFDVASFAAKRAASSCTRPRYRSCSRSV